jgi:hypothetical protein
LRSTSSSAEPGSLALDDYLGVIRRVRREWQLPQPNFGLKQIQAQANAAVTMERVVDAIIEHWGSKIRAKADLLLDEGDPLIYAEVVATPGLCSDHSIHPGRVRQVLRRVLELGLQTIALLPARYPKSNFNSQRVKSLGSKLTRLAGEMSTILEMDEMSDRLRVLDGESWKRLPKLGPEMLWAANLLTLSPKVKKVKTDSPNPQIQFGLYFVEFITAGTGRQHYGDLTQLMEATFIAAGNQVPAWVGRLGIEMDYKKRLRKDWARNFLLAP